MRVICLFLLTLVATSTRSQEVSNIKITILSTMMADTRGVGEWGFSALVEADDQRILFDAGLKPTTVFDNANELKVSLAKIPWLILSHNHLDHAGGVAKLRAAYKDSGSFNKIFTGPGFFYRDVAPGGLRKSTDSITLTATGLTFEPVATFRQIAPGIYLSGATPRVHDEKNYPLGKTLQTPQGTIDDNVPEDMSMVIKTREGLILLSGCGHAGIVNTITHVRNQFPGLKIITVIGGFHLLDTPEEKIAWTATKLSEAGVQYFVGAHCTGLNSVYQIREAMNLPKDRCRVGTVGMTYSNTKGINSGWMK